MASVNDRARAYLAKLPPAIAGQGGHAATFAAACRLVEFGLNAAEAFAALAEWNQTHCRPPWRESELRHKLADAFRHTAPRPEFAAGRGAERELAKPPPPSPDPDTKRPALPPLRAGTAAECAALAALRGLAIEGVRLAAARGLLRFGRFRGRPAWFILDGSGRVAQARRLDGAPWAGGAKAWTLAGSQAAWPVGILEAADFPVLALVEGGPDLLAACAFIRAEAREANCAPVAMLGGRLNIHPDALPRFAGKRVRLFPHVDATGAAAVDRWATQLADAGADVDAFSFADLRRADGAPVKDLNDLAAIHPDDFEQHRCVWTLLP
jgi:hypothetical protein